MHSQVSRQQILERAVLKIVLLPAAATLWLGLSQLGAGFAGLSTEAEGPARPAALGSPRALIEKHHCWTGAAPRRMVGKVPGHAVVTFGAGLPTYVGARGVGFALGHVFEGKHPEITVHAFCR